jgi:hypothetical protein
MMSGTDNVLIAIKKEAVLIITDGNNRIFPYSTRIYSISFCII